MLGAPNFTTNRGLERGLGGDVNDVALAGGRLFVADGANNRVLIYGLSGLATFTAPTTVVGQPDLASNGVNAFGASARSLSAPHGVYSDGTRLVVCDRGNHRVLVYDTIPVTHGAAADLVLGQADFSGSSANRGGAIGAGTLSNPWRVTELQGRLAVVDSGNVRVLIYPATLSNGVDASVVLGQPDFTSSTQNFPAGTPTASNLTQQPRGVASDGTRLFVADYLNNRILIWNSLPTMNATPADVVLGQPDFTSNVVNNGGVSAQSLSSVNSVNVSGTRLIASDYQNSRVLIWNTIPTVNFAPANVVVGQPGMTTNTANNGGIGPARMYRPYAAASDGTRLAVVDYQNNRVLVWNTAPVVNSAPADIVLGQSNFVNTALRSSGPSASTFQNPRGVHFDGQRLYVADYLNWRTLIWNSPPASSFQPADVVLSQPDFDTAVLGYPSGVPTAANSRKSNYLWRGTARLYEADHDNNRVLVWNTVPSVNNTAGSFALGQPDLVSGNQNTGGVSASSMKRPQSVMEDPLGRVIVSDTENYRVLIWTTPPGTSGAPADLVLGQADMSTIETGVISARRWTMSSVAFSDGDRLFVADGPRILVWTTFPTVNDQPADLVLGQPDFTTRTVNYGGLSASSLAGVSDLWTDGERLIAADVNNNRILVWQTFPTANLPAADVIIGQPDATSGGINTGGISEKALNHPGNISVSGDTLWVSDSSNHRVMRFTLPPR